MKVIDIVGSPEYPAHEWNVFMTKTELIRVAVLPLVPTVSVGTG
jgi:hypothetical protein